jgi:hypothetical protein
MIEDQGMSTPAIYTLIKMMENLPEDTQDQVVELLREVIAEIEDDAAWNTSYKKTQDKLISAGIRARQEISEGRSTPMDYSKL